MHKMLQQKEPKDYVIGTGESHSVAEFVALVLKELSHYGDAQRFSRPIEDFVEVDQQLIRRNEIHNLRADFQMAFTDLGWAPEVDFPGLVRIMVEKDLAAAGVQFATTVAAD
jgi:GDPmannose 4,6-dehydratase